MQSSIDATLLVVSHARTDPEEASFCSHKTFFQKLAFVRDAYRSFNVDATPNGEYSLKSTVRLHKSPPISRKEYVSARLVESYSSISTGSPKI